MAQGVRVCSPSSGCSTVWAGPFRTVGVAGSSLRPRRRSPLRECTLTTAGRPPSGDDHEDVELERLGCRAIMRVRGDIPCTGPLDVRRSAGLPRTRRPSH